MKGKISKITTATLITMALSAGSMVYAAPSDKHVDLQDGNIVVTVNRAAQEKKTVSDTVDVITRSEIEKSGATDLYDVLKNVADLNLNQSARTGHVMKIRGMSSNHTLFLVDGMRLAGEDVSETQNVYALDRIPLGNVERIEIVKGAASAQYGSDALGGVINIITRDSETPSQSLSLSTGTKASTVNYHASTGAIGKFSGDINLNFTDKRKVNNGQGSYLLYGDNKYLDFKGKYKVNQYDNIQLDLGYVEENNKSNMYDINLNIPAMDLNKMMAHGGPGPVGAPGNHGPAPVGPQPNHGPVGAPVGAPGGHGPVGAPGNPGPVGAPGNPAPGGHGNHGPGFEVIPAIQGFARKDQVVNYHNKRYDVALAYNGQTDKSIYSFRTYYSQLNKKQDLYNNPTIDSAVAKQFNQAVNTDKGMLQGMLNGPGAKYMPPQAIAGMKKGLAELQSMPNLNPIKYDFDNLKYKIYGVEFNNTLQADDHHTLTYNADFHHSKVEGTRIKSGDAHNVSKQGNGVEVTKKYGQKELNTMSFYLQDQMDLTKKLNLLLGLRYDHDSNFGSKFTPRTGLVYNLDDNNRLKLNLSTAYKAPTLSELYMYRLHNEASMEFYIVGNDKLRPEESTNWDLSYEAEFGKKQESYGKITYFNNRVKNLIHYKPIEGPQLTYQYMNIDRAKISGTELTLGTKLSKTWSAKFNYTWLNPRDSRTNQRLDENAAQTGSLQFVYDDNQAKGWTSSLAANFTKDYKFNKSPEEPHSKSKLYSYTTMDFTLDKKFGKGSHAFVGIDNLFNVKRNDIGITGRMWRVGGEWTF